MFVTGEMACVSGLILAFFSSSPPPPLSLRGLLSEERTNCEEPPPSLHGAETGSVGSRMPVRWGGGSFARERDMKKKQKNTSTLIKKKRKIASYMRKSRREQLQSHI
jgi:hypothetical protein